MQSEYSGEGGWKKEGMDFLGKIQEPATTGWGVERRGGGGGRAWLPIPGRLHPAASVSGTLPS